MPLVAIAKGLHDKAIAAAAFVRTMKAGASRCLASPASTMAGRLLTFLAAASFRPALSSIDSEFDPLLPLIPQLAKKQQVTTQSLAKVENAVYQLAIRRKEFEGRPEVLAEMVRRSLAAGASGAQEGGEGPAGGGEGGEEDGGGEGMKGGKRAAGGAGGRPANATGGGVGHSKRGRAHK